MAVQFLNFFCPHLSCALADPTTNQLDILCDGQLPKLPTRLTAGLFALDHLHVCSGVTKFKSPVIDTNSIVDCIPETWATALVDAGDPSSKSIPVYVCVCLSRKTV